MEGISKFWIKIKSYFFAFFDINWLSANSSEFHHKRMVSIKNTLDLEASDSVLNGDPF